MELFEKEKVDSKTYARLGRLHLKNGIVETPVFMPVGTRGAVRGLASFEMQDLDAKIMLANTYHLFERPGHELIGRQGGLHRFMAWDRPLLTDSGGFQVFSLAASRKITEDGVHFKSFLNGSTHFLNPEKVIEIQETFGSDIMMVLDECPPADASRDQIAWAVERTSRWAKRAIECKKRDDLQMFPIVQGGVHFDLRIQSLESLLGLESQGFRWPGIALGGLSVGEKKEDFVRILYELKDRIPEDRPRYLMGVGTPRDLVFAVACGIDMFDCVLPSRNGRHGIVMTKAGRMNLFNAQYAEDSRPLDETCQCRVCKTTSRSLIRHQFQVGDTLAGRLCTYHNIAYFLDLMREIREAIREDRFADFTQEFLASDSLFLGSEKSFSDYPLQFRVA